MAVLEERLDKAPLKSAMYLVTEIYLLCFKNLRNLTGRSENR